VVEAKLPRHLLGLEHLPPTAGARVLDVGVAGAHDDGGVGDDLRRRKTCRSRRSRRRKSRKSRRRMRRSERRRRSRRSSRRSRSSP
jgi:hypothetical protein